MSARPLTSAEIALAMQVFQSSIDYAKVSIVKGKHFSFQGDDTAVTPDNRIFMPPSINLTDYAANSQSPERQALFIHELVHVWQYQNNVLSPSVAAPIEFIANGFQYHKAYQYLIEEGKDLLQYKIEQQASIIEDYFRVQYLGIRLSRNNAITNLQNNIPQALVANALRRPLLNFIANPNYARHSVVCKRVPATKSRPVLNCEVGK